MKITVAGEELVLLAERAVYWPAKKTLLVADVHWGKSETFRGHGIFVPDGVFESDLERLSCALERCDATRLMVLGDLVHAKAGLTEEVESRITQWRENNPVEFHLIRGNHDKMQMPQSWNIEVHDGSIVEGPFMFSHEPERATGVYVWGGHIHPMAKIVGRGDSIRLPCFYIGQHVGALPAFSEFTRGVTVRRAKGEKLYAIVEGHILAV